MIVTITKVLVFCYEWAALTVGFGNNDFLILKWLNSSSDRAEVPVWPRAYCKVFFMLTHLLMGSLHGSRKNLREKDFPLVDVENLEIEGVLKERCFWSNENKVLWNCSVKDYYFEGKICWLEKHSKFTSILSNGFSQNKFWECLAFAFSIW